MIELGELLKFKGGQMEAGVTLDKLRGGQWVGSKVRTSVGAGYGGKRREFTGKVIAAVNTTVIVQIDQNTNVVKRILAKDLEVLEAGGP